tara:strand:+ start:4506 stop:5045 length:540 start_codon:yes stop_codon:yes gene_type:complete
MALDFNDEYNKVESSNFGDFFNKVTPEQYERFGKMAGGGMRGAGTLLGNAWGKIKSPFQQQGGEEEYIEQEEETLEDTPESEGLLKRMQSMFGIQDKVTTGEIVPGYDKKEQGVYPEPNRFGPPNAITPTTEYDEIPEYLQNPEYSPTGNNLMTMLLRGQKNRSHGIYTKPFNSKKWSE